MPDPRAPEAGNIGDTDVAFFKGCSDGISRSEYMLLGLAV